MSPQTADLIRYLQEAMNEKDPLGHVLSGSRENREEELEITHFGAGKRVERSDAVDPTLMVGGVKRLDEPEQQSCRRYRQELRLLGHTWLP